MEDTVEGDTTEEAGCLAGRPVVAEPSPLTRMLNPLIAYPVEAIDPNADDGRDEGDERLRLLRPILRMGARGDNANLLDYGSDESLGAYIAGTPTARAAVLDGILKADATQRPAIRLIAPTTRLLSPEVADRLSEEDRVRCVPVRGNNRVAVLNWPSKYLPKPKVTLDFPKRITGSGEAHVQITREGTTLELNAFSGSGSRNRVILENLDGRLIDRLFATGTTDELGATLTPQLPGELPASIMHDVADFWQRHLRCHVIASVCAPDEATRPLAFSSIKARREGRDRSKAVLRCKLHASSVACACGLWGLPSISQRMPTERFVDSEVDLTLSMCGRPLKPNADGSPGLCSLHGQRTPSISLLPSICCYETTAQLGCSHTTACKGRKSGMWSPDMRIKGVNVLHAQVLIAGAMRCVEKTQDLLGKRPAEEISQECERVAGQLKGKLGEVDRRRAVAGIDHSSADLLKLDMQAHDMLASGKVYQHERPSSKDVVLACEQDDGKPSVLCGEEAKIAQTHLGLFRPPQRRRYN